MKQKAYLQATVFIFSVVAIVHLLRLLNGWSINISGFEVPMWASWVAVLVAAFLAYQGVKFVNKK